eukprot:g10092.t1
MVERGHELRADIFVSLKDISIEGSASSQSQAPHKWLPCQVKVTKKRPTAWERKLRLVLRTRAAELHTAVLIGLSLDAEEPAFLHVVHRHNNYDATDPTAPEYNVTRAALAASIHSLLTSPEAVLYDNPSRAFANSTTALVEIDARNDFQNITAGSGVVYQPNRLEFTPVDGCVFLSSHPDRKFRVQEKTLSIRRENGVALGLRTSLLRKSGEAYRRGDADFLLAHARDDVCAAQPARFRIHGCVLIPWEELWERGYLSDEDGFHGCGMLSLYPQGCPGVRRARSGWLETLFTKRKEVAKTITHELQERLADA